MNVLDICAGTGSATSAFRDRGHNVETLDIVGNQTYICDVRDFVPEKKYDFVWASPPCTEFSLLKKIKCAERTLDLSIVDSCFRICRSARYWMLENPRACLRHFRGMPKKTIMQGLFGAPTQKPTDLWGVFPDFSPACDEPKTKTYVPWSQAHDDGLRSERAVRRAMIPYNLSLAICLSIELSIENGGIYER